jgi:hypothetical protein
MQIRIVLLCCALALISACAFFGATREFDGAVLAGKKVTHLAYSEAAVHIFVLQKLNIAYQGREQTMLLQTEIDALRLAMVGVDPLGKKIFQIERSDNTAGFVIAPFSAISPEPDVLLLDFQLIFWPEALVAYELGLAGFTVETGTENDKTFRSIHLNKRPVVRIEYEDPDPWRGSVVLQNFVSDYVLRIETVDYESH